MTVQLDPESALVYSLPGSPYLSKYWVASSLEPSLEEATDAKTPVLVQNHRYNNDNVRDTMLCSQYPGLLWQHACESALQCLARITLVKQTVEWMDEAWLPWLLGRATARNGRQVRYIAAICSIIS